jgi:hypothetical protein
MSKIPSKKIGRLVILAGAALFIVLWAVPPVRAQEPIRIEITEVPYRPVYAFLRVHFEFAGKQEFLHQEWQTTQKDDFMGFGIGLISAKDSDIQFESNISYQRYKSNLLGVPDFDMLHELDIQLGGRFFPRYPTFGLGKIPVRLTFSALGGIGLLMPNGYDIKYDLSVLLSAGLMISSGSNASGFLIEVVYRPLTTSFKLDTAEGAYLGMIDKKPSIGIRLAWLFAPSGN